MKKQKIDKKSRQNDKMVTKNMIQEVNRILSKNDDYENASIDIIDLFSQKQYDTRNSRILTYDELAMELGKIVDNSENNQLSPSNKQEVITQLYILSKIYESEWDNMSDEQKIIKVRRCKECHNEYTGIWHLCPNCLIYNGLDEIRSQLQPNGDIIRLKKSWKPSF